jgi:hypothetical protein
MGVTDAPDGTLVGGTYHPLQFHNYDPTGDRWYRSTDVYGQLNVAESTDEYVYFAMYTNGGLYAWDPYEDWDPPQEEDRPQNRDRNPKWLTSATYDSDGSDIGRPYCLLIHPNERHVIMGGSGGYGEGFGGLLIWDRKDQTRTEVPSKDVHPDQNTFCLAALPNGNVLGGTSTNPPAGYSRQAENASLYEMNPETKEVVWREAVYDDLGSKSQYWDLTQHEGMVYGVTYPRGTNRYFVFDPQERSIVYERDLDRRTPHQQGPQVFHHSPDGRLFVVFAHGDIAEVNAETHELEDIATLPEEGREPQAGHLTDDIVRNGGVVHDGRLYFLTDTQLLSWEIQ